MSSFFHIDMLPAREGDCIWIEYGKESGRTHRVLIDGGRKIAYQTMKQRIAELPDDERKFDLMVLTHVDADHTEGFLELVEDADNGISFCDVWYNGYHHLLASKKDETFGPKQGERFTIGVIKRQWPWNKAFGHKSVSVPEGGALPTTTLAGGMKVTLLSPTPDALAAFEPIWLDKVQAAGMTPHDPETRESLSGEVFGSLNSNEVKKLAASKYEKDKSRANNTSIAMLMEYEGKAALMTGDAHAETLIPNLERLESTPEIGAFKLSHHGSKGALPRELIELVPCSDYLVSTDGSRHDHPDREAIARLISFKSKPARIHCNYPSEEILEWDQTILKNKYHYSIVTPDQNNSGVIRIEL